VVLLAGVSNSLGIELANKIILRKILSCKTAWQCYFGELIP
jgi:hypothetical protein